MAIRRQVMEQFGPAAFLARAQEVLSSATGSADHSVASCPMQALG